MNRPDVTPFFDHATNTWTYLVSDPDTGEAVIIDAVLDYDPKGARVSHNGLEALYSVVERRQLKLRWILETHVHADHLAGGHWLRDKSGAPLVIGARIAEVQKVFAPRFGMDDLPTDGRQFDVLVEDGATLPLGNLTIRVMHTPGHTPGSCCFRVNGALVAGDTLFLQGCGRTDLPGGDPAEMRRTLSQRFSTLPDDTVIYPGHNYGGPKAPLSALRKTNPVFDPRWAAQMLG